MSDWSPERAIAMEQRHILEGEKRVAQQEALLGESTEKRYDQLTHRAGEVLGFLRYSLELSRDRLRYLEDRMVFVQTPGYGTCGRLLAVQSRIDLARSSVSRNPRPSGTVTAASGPAQGLSRLMLQQSDSSHQSARLGRV